MEKQCGYVDKNGKFHKTLFECNNENLEIRMKELKEDIKDLTFYYEGVFYTKLMAIKQREISGIGSDNMVKDIIKTFLWRDSETLLEFSAKKKEIEEEYEQLQKKSNTPKTLRTNWWISKL